MKRPDLRTSYLRGLAWAYRTAEREIRRLVGSDRACPVCGQRPCFDHCYTCRADCSVTDHEPWCAHTPYSHPHTEEDEYLRGGARCCACGDRFRVGDSVFSRPIGDDTYDSVCSACAVTAPIP